MKYGKLTVFTGCMFAGKSSHLLAALRRAQYAKKRVALYKPSIDTRYSEKDVVTHDNSVFNAHCVSKAWEIFMHISETEPKIDVVGIDEAQFFDHALTSALHAILFNGIDIFVAALDRTSDNEPFGPVPGLLTYADEVYKLKAVCVKCGDDASLSYRTAPSTDTVMVGGADKYEARCYPCWSQDA